MTNLANPPTIEPTSEWLAARRAHLVRALEEPGTPTRRRRTWRVAAVALAVLLIAGAAVAATGYTLFDWLHSGNPGEARFSIDATRTVTWPAPASLGCDSPGAREFSCAAGASAKWRYEFFGRVETETITRDTALTGLAETERAGGVSHEDAERIRAQIAAVSDEFFEKLNLLAGFNSVASPHQVRPGVIRVPPGDVPQFVVCRPGGDAFACVELAASEDVPVGAPFYGLDENEDWVEKPYRPARTDFGAMLESIFGRKLTPAEIRLLVTFATVATTEGPASGATVARPTTTGG